MGDTKRIVLACVAVGLSACGGKEDDMGMFNDVRNGVIISKSLDLPSGEKIQLLQAQVPDSESEPIILTLVPPHKKVTADQQFDGFEIVPLINVYAVVQWGNGQDGLAQADIDFGSGVSLPLRGSSIRIYAVNRSGQTAEQIGAFLSRGTNTNGQPRRTIVGTKDGTPIADTNRLFPSGLSDKQAIPPYVRSVSVQLWPGLLPPVGTGTVTVLFYDSTGTQNVSRVALNIAQQAFALEVPSDAAFIQVENALVGLNNLYSVRYVFDLNL